METDLTQGPVTGHQQPAADDVAQGDGKKACKEKPAPGEVRQLFLCGAQGALRRRRISRIGLCHESCGDIVHIRNAVLKAPPG